MLSASTNSLYKAEIPHSLYPIMFFLKWYVKAKIHEYNFFTMKKKTKKKNPTLPLHSQLWVGLGFFSQSPCSQLFLKQVLSMLSKAEFSLSHTSWLLLWKSFLHKLMCQCRSHCCSAERLKVCMSQTICCALFLCSLTAARHRKGTISACTECL